MAEATAETKRRDPEHPLPDPGSRKMGCRRGKLSERERLQVEEVVADGFCKEEIILPIFSHFLLLQFF